MKKYIDAQKLKDAMNIKDDTNGRFDIMTALQCVDDAPTADLTPCDVCKYNPPSSGDEKPCLLCPACKY